MRLIEGLQKSHLGNKSTLSNLEVHAVDDFLLGSITVPAAERAFFAKDRLTEVVHEHKIGAYFKRWFLAGAGVVEAPSEEQRIGCHQLMHDVSSNRNIEEFGGEKSVETKLQVIWHLLSLQADGYPGTLLVNNYANIFYVRDQFGGLRVVGLSRSVLCRAWHLNACSTASSFLGAKVRVFIPHKS